MKVTYKSPVARVIINGLPHDDWVSVAFYHYVPTRHPPKSTGIPTALIYYQELSKAQNALLKCIISVSSITQCLTKTRDYVPEKITTGKPKVYNMQTLWIL